MSSLADARHTDHPFTSRHVVWPGMTLALLSWGHVCYQLGLDLLAGGNNWKQGDWLINSAGGPIRRSATGDLMIRVSDLTGADLLSVVVLVQVVLLSVLYGIVALWMWRNRDGSVAVLALSSGMFIVFWLVDPQGSVRKEIITFVALCVFVSGVFREQRLLQCIGCGLFALSVSAHEATVLFFPLFAVLTVLAHPRGKPDPVLVLLLVVTLVCVVGLTVSAIAHRQIDDPMRVCAALLDRGLSVHMCDGAIQWLGHSTGDAINRVVDQTGVKTVSNLLVGYAVCLMPFLYIACRCTKRLLAVSLVLAPAALFLPLYAVAVDHGRWMSFHAMSTFVLYCAALRSGRLALRQPLQPVTVLLLVSLSLIIVHGHMRWIVWGGVFRRLLDAVI